MAIQLASNLTPKNDQTFYLLEDIYVKGGLMIQDSISTRDALPFNNLKLGQLVLTLADGLCWQVTELSGPTLDDPVAPEVIVWTEFSFGGDGGTGGGLNPRQVAIHVIEDLPPSSSSTFVLELGLSAIILKLEVSRPVKVTAYATPTADEPNPYVFLATADHLIDDGATLLSDGTIIRSRQYSIFANMESPPLNKIYMKIDSIDGGEGPVTLTINYLTLETAV